MNANYQADTLLLIYIKPATCVSALINAAKS